MQVAFPTTPFAIALSGGADSWALVLMAQEQGVPFTALTVDHRLRPESTAEAQSVSAACRKRGIPHQILTWEHSPIESRIQERAREARYELLTGYCRDHKIAALLTAHHADDQGETVLMRIAHASDVGGLAGLRETTLRDGIAITRPLLNTTKQELIDYVTAKGVVYVQDPSNSNDRYARPRLRAARDILEAEGLTPALLNKLAGKMAAADDALAFATRELISSHAQWENPVVLALPAGALTGKPTALRQRALVDIWRRVTGETGYAPEAETLQTVLSTITTKQTFGGMVMEPHDDTLRFYRELQATTDTITIAPHSDAVWDRRFRIVNGGTHTVTITALGNTPTAAIEKTAPWAAAIRPAAARATLPACDNVPLVLGTNAESTLYAVSL